MSEEIRQVRQCYTETFVGTREQLISRISDMYQRGWSTDYICEAFESLDHALTVEGKIENCDQPWSGHSFLVVYVAN